MMRLVEIFLPLADPDENRFDKGMYDELQHELSERFGGVTLYPRAPASGVWKNSESEKQVDDLVVFEVMTPEVEKQWCRSYCAKLEVAFRQEKVMVRAYDIELL